MRPHRVLRRATAFAAVTLAAVTLAAVTFALLMAPCAAPAAHAAPATVQGQAEQGHDAQAAGGEEEGEDAGASFSALEETVDAVYLGFPPFGLVELPRLFVLKKADGSWGLDGYWSTRRALESGRYGLRHETEAGTQKLVSSPQALGEMMTDHEYLHANIAALGGASIAVDLSMTKHLFYALLAGVLVLVLCVSLARRYRHGVGRETAPRGFVQNAVEASINFIRDDIARPALGEQHYRTFMPFLLTSFFFILLGNLFALIPYTAAPTANISVTLALALFTFIIGQVYASKAHWKELFTGPPGVPVVIRVIMVPIEIVGLLVRHLALAIRLFANMMAGTLVVFSLIGLIFLFHSLFGAVAAWISTPVSVGFALFILAIKLLVSFIQAYVFTALSAIFIGMAIEEHGDMDLEEEAPHASAESETGTLKPALGGDGATEEEHYRREGAAAPARAAG